jgi:hypothetical protein
MSIGLTEEVDLVARELDSSHAQIGYRLQSLERKSDTQVVVGE